MAVLDKVVEENQGLIKEPDKDSISILMDIVQKDIYMHPIESSIRENFSNAFDSIKERKIALSILNEETEINDHFVEDSRIETKASIFDISYYDTQYLSKDNDKVVISYIVNEENGKDMLYFKDKGVGLAGKRLEGYMRPGYSSKRLNKDMLGKYGLGSKSALSTNIEYYVLESWHNGYYTKFMVYDSYYKCIIPKNKSDKVTYIIGHKVILVKDENGEEIEEIVEVKEPIYWEKTEELNGVTVSFNVKSYPGNKERFIEAVKKQLMYFIDTLQFEIIENGVSFEPSFKAKILHETDLFLVSTNSYFTVPHILINNVNYNIINFPELGMNKLYGSIAVKAKSSDVDIAANRESVKWTEKTRMFIQTAVKAASEEAGNILEDKLSSIENPVERYLTATNYQSSDDDATLIKQLRNFGGSVKLNVNIDPKQYLTKEELKKAGVKGNAPMVPIYRMLDLWHKFNTSIISANDYHVSIAELKDITELDFNKLFYIHHEDNSYNIRLSLALYIKRNLINDNSNNSYQFLAFNDFMPKPMDKEEFFKVTIKGGIKDNKKALASYRSYLIAQEKKKLHLALFIAIIKKYAYDINDITTETLKSFTKSINLAEDPVLRQTVEQKKQGHKVSMTINTISESQTKKENLVKLKKEKQVLAYRSLYMRKFINGDKKLGYLSYEDHYTFSLHDINTISLPDIKNIAIYASTTDRDLLVSAAYMYMLTSTNHKYNSSLGDGSEGIVFIQIAKDNIKFFKEIPGSMDVKKYIKEEHSVDNGKLHIKFGNTVSKFVTGIYLHKLIALNSVHEALASPKYIGLLKEYIGEDETKSMQTAYEMLRRFPTVVKTNDEEDPIERIKNNFKQVLDTSTSSTDDLLDSLYSLSEIQNLPVEGLPDEQKVVVQKFNEVEIDVFDKVFIDNLEQDLLKYREVMEIILIRFMIKEASTHYDKTRIFQILDAQIEEKLVSL